MTYYYFDPSRVNDDHALEDCEIFYADDTLCDELNGDNLYHNDYQPGWYYIAGMYGYLPDGDPSGPYDTELDALIAAREDWIPDNESDFESAIVVYAVRRSFGGGVLLVVDIHLFTPKKDAETIGYIVTWVDVSYYDVLAWLDVQPTKSVYIAL